MKTKLGWAIGVNVAVACLLMQGCKATRVAKGPDYGNEVKTVETPPTAPAQTDDIKVSTAPAQTQAPAQELKVEEAPAPEVKTAEVPVAIPAPEPEFTFYTVKPGDMLSKISRRYNIRQKAILDLNPGLQPNKLYAGRKIKLPGNVAVDAAPASAVPSASAPAAASVKAPAAAKAAKYTGATKEYVVKNGDSLGKIAHGNGTNIRTLKEINGLKTDRVYIGQKLKVPAEKAAAHAKKEAKAAAPAKKDAKAAPAKDAKAPAAAAPEKKKEDAAAKTPAPAAAPAAAFAQETAAPAAAADAAAPAAAETAPATADAAPAASEQASAPAPKPAATGEFHIVKEGEDVVSIAISYGVSPGAIMDLNDLKSSEVKPGDKLRIPAKNAQ